MKIIKQLPIVSVIDLPGTLTEALTIFNRAQLASRQARTRSNAARVSAQAARTDTLSSTAKIKAESAASAAIYAKNSAGIIARNRTAAELARSKAIISRAESDINVSKLAKLRRELVDLPKLIAQATATQAELQRQYDAAVDQFGVTPGIDIDIDIGIGLGDIGRGIDI